MRKHREELAEQNRRMEEEAEVEEIYVDEFRCEPCKKIGSGKWRGMYMLWEDKGGRWVKDLEKGGMCKESHFKLMLLSHVTFESVYLGIHD